MSDEKMNVYLKVSNLRASIEGLKKDAEGHNYDYVSGNMVLGILKVNMDELHLLLIPELNYDSMRIDTLESENYKNIYICDPTDSTGKKKIQKTIVNKRYEYIVRGKMNYVWVDAENPEDRIVIPWAMMGQQNDDIAKAFGTALTYTERYFLLKFFNFPTDIDDPDFDQIKSIGDATIKSATEFKTELPARDNIVIDEGLKAAEEAVKIEAAKVAAAKVLADQKAKAAADKKAAKVAAAKAALAALEADDTVVAEVVTPVTPESISQVDAPLIEGEGTPVAAGDVPFNTTAPDPNATEEIPVAKMNKAQVVAAMDKYFFAQDAVKTSLLAKIGVGSFQECGVKQLKKIYKQLPQK